MPEPGRVRIPLRRHIGAPCVPVVKAGDEVCAGQKIADSGEFVSAPVHASITGRVAEVTDEFIVVDGNGKVVAPPVSARHYDDLSPREIIEIVREAGIVGMGGAAFPAHVKLTPPEGRTFECVILNGAECEPYLTIDERMLIEQPEKILYGLCALLKATGAVRGYIGIESDKAEALRIMEEAVSGHEAIEVVPLKVVYPQGGEKMLIKSILGREVPVGGLPVDVGVLVHNVGTAVAVADAVGEGKTLYERGITVTGRGVKRPGNLSVRIGTSFRDIIDFCGGLTEDAARVIAGGPMMGRAVAGLDEVVTKGTSGILVLPEQEIGLVEERVCIRCGKCVDSCPMLLTPNNYAVCSRQHLLEEARKLNILNCIECGCCDYVCPSKIPLVHLIRQCKDEIASEKRKK